MSATPILIISSNSEIAGGEHYLLSCLKYLDRTRYHPIVWLPGDGKFRAALDEAGVEYVIEPVNYGWLRPARLWYEFLAGMSGRVRRIAELIRARDIGLVHSNTSKILEGALAARLSGTRHLFLAHIEHHHDMPIYGRFPLDGRSFAEWMGEMSAGIIAVSNVVRDSLCPPLSLDRIKVVHNGLEMARYDAALAARDGSLRHSLGLPDSAVLVVAAGRVIVDKGFDLLIEAAARLVPIHPDCHFLICGPAPSRDYQAGLQARALQLGLSQNVHFLGMRSDLPNVLAQSDVFALSSRREGHPYVLLEAMACELPSVSSNCGGVAETVLEGETGYVVPLEDVDLLAERLAPLLVDPDLRRRMGAAAGRHVRAHFSAKLSAEGLFAMYEHLLAAPAPAPGAHTVDLLLQACTEIGDLGGRLTQLEERVKKTEQDTALLFDNPLMRGLRSMKRRLSGSGQ